MTALAMAAASFANELPVETPAQAAASSLYGLLSATADCFPQRLAFADQPGRDAWSGRPRIAWTYANTRRIVDRLAAFLVKLGLPAGAPVGISLPNGSEACVTLLAVERAGYTPCLLPAGWPEDLLANALEVANVATILCQTRLAEERPAEMFCRHAARYYGIRFVCAFGPQVPDGVIDLDRAILDTPADESLQEPKGCNGVVTFVHQDRSVRPVFRPGPSLLSAAAACLVPQTVRAGERILSLLAPDDLKGLTTGLVASLVTGATLEAHGLFDGASLGNALKSEVPTHLVAPGWMEEALAAAGLCGKIVRSVVLVHDAPVRFKARGELEQAVVDVLNLGEVALVARARSAAGHLDLSLEGPGSDETTRGRLDIKSDDDGTLLVRGTATEIYDFARGTLLNPAPDVTWRSTGCKADVFAGVVTGVR